MKMTDLQPGEILIVPFGEIRTQTTANFIDNRIARIPSKSKSRDNLLRKPSFSITKFDTWFFWVYYNIEGHSDLQIINTIPESFSLTIPDIIADIKVYLTSAFYAHEREGRYHPYGVYCHFDRYEQIQEIPPKYNFNIDQVYGIAEHEFPL